MLFKNCPVFFFTIIFGFGLISSCTETDICEDIVCLNGGECVDGACECEEGFTGGNCETDLCDLITCENDGICELGICNCPDGFAGSDCTVLLIPDRLKITELKLLGFSETQPDGTSWDQFGGRPDVYFWIRLPNGLEYDGSPAVIENALFDSVYDMTPDQPIWFNNLNGDHIFSLRDLDDTGYDEIGFLGFSPIWQGTHFDSAQFDLPAGSNGYSVKMKFEMYWD